MARVRALPAATIVHTPVMFRERMGRATASTLEAMVSSDAAEAARGNALEEARTKLLLGQPPKGGSLRKELAERLQLWERGEFPELLERAEVQAHARQVERRRRRPAVAQTLRAKRAVAMARDGAYAKAIRSLTSSMADLRPEEQLEWAQRLLPRSSRAAVALARSAHGLAERRRERGGPEPPRNTDMEVEGDASGVPTEGRGVSSGTSTGGSAARSVGQGERDWLILNAPFLHAPAPAGERSTTRESAAAAPSVGACSGGANGGLPSGRRGPPAPGWRAGTCRRPARWSAPPAS